MHRSSQAIVKAFVLQLNKQPCMVFRSVLPVPSPLERGWGEAIPLITHTLPFVKVKIPLVSDPYAQQFAVIYLYISNINGASL